MRQRRRTTTLLIALAMLAALAMPAHSVTQWKTRANILSDDHGSFTETSMNVGMDLPRPYAVRIGFATPQSRRVHFDYSVFCDRGNKGREDSIRTDGGWKRRWITVYSGRDLGDYCDVSLFANVNDGTPLRTLVQYKRR